MKYPNPPIIEAVIDFQVEPYPPESLKSLKDLCGKLKSEFPSIKEMAEFQGQFQKGSVTGASTYQKQLGFRLENLENPFVCLLRLNGFTSSKLKPYDSWPPFIEKAKHLWQQYRETSGNNAIQRIAVRYINRLDIPLPIENLKDYLNPSPEGAHNLDYALSGFLLNLKFDAPEINGGIIINETSIKPVIKNTAAIILDIDVFSNKKIPQDENELWEVFNSLRLHKNKVFESFITNKTRELFK